MAHLCCRQYQEGSARFRKPGRGASGALRCQRISQLFPKMCAPRARGPCSLREAGHEAVIEDARLPRLDEVKSSQTTLGMPNGYHVQEDTDRHKCSGPWKSGDKIWRSHREA